MSLVHGNHRPCTHVYVAEGCVYCPRDRVVYIDPTAWLAACGMNPLGTTSCIAFYVLSRRAADCLPKDSVDGYIWLRPGLMPSCHENIPPGARARAIIAARGNT